MSPRCLPFKSTMASETYRKIGRGGAGNYYSPQDLDEAANRINEV